MSSSNLHSAWAELFLRSLAAAGLRDVVISPGSRSTPLALAAARVTDLRCHPVVDERSAAFFALGQARVTGKPSALICTSGTAAAHYLPAIIEASQSHLPMLALTADRPWELQDCAAPQTIDQLKLFGDHVRHFAELGLPDASETAMRAAARIAAQAVALTLHPRPGPVHVNARFRKPLEPVAMPGPEPWQARWEEIVRRGPTRVLLPRSEPAPEALDEIAERAARAERGLIVCGPGPIDRRLGPAIVALARATGFPVLAEATSGARFLAAGAGLTVCAAFDAVLRAPAFRKAHAPDLILEIGAPPTSSSYAQYLGEHPQAARFALAPHGWNDPASSATALLIGDPVLSAEGIARRLGERRGGPSAWAQSFASADRIAWKIAEDLAEGPALTEAAVARAVIAGCPEGSVLVIGNSMPVRDVDVWAPPRRETLDVAHQRGASGIDGLFAGAAGVASTAGRPVTLLLGDVSALHDLGGLALARRAPVPLVIVVVQNGGGRIFAHLPIGKAAAPEVFDKYFLMPEPVDLAAAAASFGIRFARVEASDALASALAQAHASPGATLIETIVPPEDGPQRAARFRTELAAALAATSAEGDR